MKKLFSILLCLCVSMIAMAQDIIVKKDGSTIISKVLEISDTQIKYKTHDNQNGPTYTISSSEVLRINYPNGSSYTPNNNQQTVQEEQKVTFEEIDEPIGQRVSDEELLRDWKRIKWEEALKKGKKLKRIGLIGGGTCVLSAIIFKLAFPPNCNDIFCPYESGSTRIWLFPASVGIIGGTAFTLIGNRKINKANRMIQSQAVYQQGFKINDNTNITADINIINDNIVCQQTLGIGFQLNF